MVGHVYFGDVCGAHAYPRTTGRPCTVWRMFFLLLSLLVNMSCSSVISALDSRNSARSALYHQFHKVIGVFEMEAEFYRKTVQLAEDCMEDFQVICETLRCRRRTPILRLEELQLEKQQILEKCNRLERNRISQLQTLKVILGNDASPIYDYFESMERSLNKALRRAISRKDWRRSVALQASLNMLTKDKNLIVQIYVEERTGTTDLSRQVSFESLYNNSKFISRRRFSK